MVLWLCSLHGKPFAMSAYTHLAASHLL